MSWLTKIAALTLPLALAACSDGGGAPDDDDLLSSEELAAFDAASIISDAEATDTGALSAGAVDSFLQSKSSCLTGHSFGGKTAGQLFAAAAKKHKVSPLFLLAHLQKESSLVSKQGGTCPSKSLSRAFGCGCPDGGSCSSKYAGFDKQLECAASLTRSYLDDLEGGGSTIAGWSVGKAKKTLDKISISPKNKVTAALYTYTPWVGQKTYGGNPAPFGNYLFWKIWAGYVKATGYQGPQASVEEPAPSELSPSDDAGNQGDPGTQGGTGGQGNDGQIGEEGLDGDPGTQGTDPPPSQPGGDTPPEEGTPTPSPSSSNDPGEPPPAPSAGACCEATPGTKGCGDSAIKACVCAQDDYCCATEWDEQCVKNVVEMGCGACGT